jgi:hypothetical protein
MQNIFQITVSKMQEIYNVSKQFEPFEKFSNSPAPLLADKNFVKLIYTE